MLKQLTVVTSNMPLPSNLSSVYFPKSASQSDDVYDPPRYPVAFIDVTSTRLLSKPFPFPLFLIAFAPIHDFMTPSKCTVTS